MNTKRNTLLNLIFVMCRLVSLNVYLVLFNFVISPILPINNFFGSEFIAFNRLIVNPFENVIKYYQSMIACSGIIVTLCLALFFTFFVGLCLPYAIKKIIAVFLKKSNNYFVNNERINEGSSFNFSGAVNSNTILLKTTKLSM